MSVFYVSQVFSDVRVFCYSNLQLRLLHLPYDIEIMWKKNNETFFFCVLYSDKTRVFDHIRAHTGSYLCYSC